MGRSGNARLTENSGAMGGKMAREEYGKCKINIYGNRREIEGARGVLDGLDLKCDEYEDRLIIQDAIDRHKVKADILYDGNTVWSYDRIIRDFKGALKSKPSPVTEYGSGDYDMTDYLYKFLSLECGSIAHYNKYGWIGTYPTTAELCGFAKRNEFGEDIMSYQPTWASDRQRISKDILNLCAGR